MRGFAEMLLSHWPDFSDQDKLDMLGEILHESKRVGRLVDELLDAARLDQGHIPLDLQPTDVGRVVARALRHLQPLYPGLDAHVDCPPDLPLVVADPDRLGQVVANIVENACKHGSPAGIRVTARPVAEPSWPAPGEAGPTGEEGWVELTISDVGPGIAPPDLPRVTEKFFRAAGPAASGLGLGLWISQGIVEAHGGRLLASSGEGGGTTVRVTMPLRGPARSGKLAGS
jgi:signal transduction histidine kinase